MKKVYKLLTIVGTRPELIKLSVALQKFEKYFNHILVHTGQNYDYRLNEIFFKDLKIKKPNYFLNCAGSSSLQTIANVISKTEKVLSKEKPDAVVVYGDTNSTLAGALVASKIEGLDLFHVEAGLRSFNRKMPEEINRRLTTQLAKYHFAPTEFSKKTLMKEHVNESNILVTGNTVIDSLKWIEKKFNKDEKFKQDIVNRKLYLDNLNGRI